MSEPIAFLSYAHADDEDGGIARLRESIGIECRMHIGRPFTIFQDRHDIRWGQEWKSRVYGTVATATFFIPVLSPSFLQSKECRTELQAFLRREKQVGRRDLILPILYIPIPELSNGKHADDLLLAVLTQRQYSDWRQLRLKDFRSEQVRTELARLAGQVRTVVDEVESLSEPGNTGAKAPAATAQTKQTAKAPRKRKISPGRRSTSTRWEGTWHSSTSAFSFVMHLSLASDGRIDGYILWRLVSVPPQSFLSNRINDSGTEFVKGRVKADGSGALFSGFKVDEPFLLALDEYDVTFDDPPGSAIRRFSGKTLTDSRDWSGNMSGVMTLVDS